MNEEEPRIEPAQEARLPDAAEALPVEGEEALQ